MKYIGNNSKSREIFVRPNVVSSYISNQVSYMNTRAVMSS